MIEVAIDNWMLDEKRRKRIAKRKEAFAYWKRFAFYAVVALAVLVALTFITLAVPTVQAAPSPSTVPAQSSAPAAVPPAGAVEPVPAQTTVKAVVTAYTSSRDETDDTPLITANGDHVHQGTIACPDEYAFGTEVMVGTTTYTCDDRMNARYRDDENFDLWTTSKTAAFDWGRRIETVTVTQ